MDVFDLRSRLVEDYARYTRSFIKIADPRIKAKVDGALDDGALWPEPLLQLNPDIPAGRDDRRPRRRRARCIRSARRSSGSTSPTPTTRASSCSCTPTRREAIRKAKEGKSYVLTSGTGSGKSLTYIVPIVDHVLRRGSGQGIQAIVVYPMNALANSQDEELKKFLEKGYRRRTVAGPVCALHGAGEGARARGDSKQPAGHPAHELHDARAAAHAT